VSKSFPACLEHHGYEYGDCADADAVAPITATETTASVKILERIEHLLKEI
jgi:hypothetical protein